jgi:hypothetical protein
MVHRSTVYNKALIKKRFQDCAAHFTGIPEEQTPAKAWAI